MLVVSVIIFFSRCATGFGPNDTDTDEYTDTYDTVDTRDTSTNNGSDVPDDTLPDDTDPPEPVLDAKYEYIELTEADVHKGYQILVNYQNIYNFDGGFNIISFYGNKNRNYKVADVYVSFDSVALGYVNEMMDAFKADTGKHDILVNSSFRTLEDQESIYESYLDKYGEEYASLYVAIPGYSEHHTGLAVDFTIYTDENTAHKFDEFPEYPEWLLNNGYKFGFIQRYPADKTDITKIAYENWHYRYIGKPHAYYVVKNNLCFEEYIDLLRSFEFDDKHLSITDDEGVSWEIYFVKANISGTTKVPVPKYLEYEISGNNVDGYIITCKK